MPYSDKGGASASKTRFFYTVTFLTWSSRPRWASVTIFFLQSGSVHLSQARRVPSRPKPVTLRKHLGIPESERGIWEDSLRPLCLRNLPTLQTTFPLLSVVVLPNQEPRSIPFYSRMPASPFRLVKNRTTGDELILAFSGISTLPLGWAKFQFPLVPHTTAQAEHLAGLPGAPC